MLDRRHIAIAVALTMTAVTSCEAPGPSGTSDMPVSSFLQERVREVLDDVERARATLPEDAPEAASALENSHQKLRRLSEYYLPLLAARQQVSTALAAVNAGNGSAGSVVDSAEAALLGIVRGHGQHLEGEMRGPLARIEDVRTALAAEDLEEASRLLEGLGHRLESLFFRGELVLRGSQLDPQ